MAEILVGFICNGCQRRSVFVRQAFLAMYGQPGDGLHNVMRRMRCRRCGAKDVDGPFRLDPDHGDDQWPTLDLSIARKHPKE